MDAFGFTAGRSRIEDSQGLSTVVPTVENGHDPLGDVLSITYRIRPQEGCQSKWFPQNFLIQGDETYHI